MNTVFYILIILGTSGSRVGVANYDNMSAFLNAKQQIESILEHPPYKAICTPSFIKEDKKK